MPEFEIVPQMQKLREYLTEKEIPWKDASDEKHAWICRTHYYFAEAHWSVINGYGTYGGILPAKGQNESLLEVKTECLNNGNPVGWLTADEVIAYMEGAGKCTQLPF